jgi:hypothetical protein
MGKASFVALVGLLSTLLIGLPGCKAIKAKAFLKECESNREGWNEAGFYLTTQKDIRSNLTGGIPMFYVGSTGGEDYFVYYYDAFDKMLGHLRLPEVSTLKWERVQFAPGNEDDRTKPVYPRDI